MQRLRSPRNKGDGPPMFSQEFILQNHADILSCVCMVIFMLLIPQVSHVRGLWFAALLLCIACFLSV